MEQPAIFSATLGLSPPWHITSVSFVHHESRMDIAIDFYEGNLFSCPECGKRSMPCSVENETWFHDNFFRYSAFLHARVPRIECCVGIVAAERPWSRAGSRFSRLLRGSSPAPYPRTQPAFPLPSGAFGDPGER